jgi:ubiquinone/menaquinone biosynthesis C-methylase UbiE
MEPAVRAGGLRVVVAANSFARRGARAATDLSRPVPDRIAPEYTSAAGDYDRRWARYNAASLALLRPWVAGRALGHVLDVGCGTGNLLALLADAGARVEAYAGLDLSPDMLRTAAEKLGRSTIPGALAAGSVEALPFADDAFDTAVSASTLHDWPDPHAGLAEVRRVLRPGGTLLLLDWDRAPLPMRALNAWMRITRVGYRRMYPRGEMAALLAEAGFRVEAQARGAAGGPWRLAAFRCVRG